MTDTRRVMVAPLHVACTETVILSYSIGNILSFVSDLYDDYVIVCNAFITNLK